MHGITFEQKQQMFQYIEKGHLILDKFEALATKVKYSAQDEDLQEKQRAKLEQMEEMRKEYITNVILIFNSFFEYGFINDRKQYEYQEEISKKKQSEAQQKRSYFPTMFTIPTTVDEDLEAVFEIDKAKTHNEMQIGEALETNLYYHSTHHFWDFVSKNCSNLETVKFINFHRQTEGSNPSELGIRWVLLAIYQREDLFEAFMAIVSD